MIVIKMESKLKKGETKQMREEKCEICKGKTNDYRFIPKCDLQKIIYVLICVGCIKDLDYPYNL